MFFLGVPFFSFLSFLDSKFINCSKSFVLKCKIETIHERVFRSLRYVDAILILLIRDAVHFQTWISTKSLNTVRYNRLTFHLNSKAFERNRDTVVYTRWEDRFVCIRKKWSSFSLGVYGPNQNLQVLTYRVRKNETNDSQHRPNKVFIIIAI